MGSICDYGGGMVWWMILERRDTDADLVVACWRWRDDM